MTIQLPSPLGFQTVTMALANDRPFTRYSSKARLEILQEPGKPIDVKKVFFTVMNLVRDNDRSVIFKDTFGNVVNLANFDYPPEQFNQAFGLISHDGRRPKVIIGFEIYSTLTFGKIKTITREHCKKHRAWLQAHLSSTWQMIDVVSIGHLHGKHPRFADIDGLQEGTWQ